MRKKKERSQGGDSSSSIGILSFEVANAMSRAVHLHRSLSDGEISFLFRQIISSPPIRSLICSQEAGLLALAAAEKLDDLNRVASVTSRLGRRCSLPSLQGFEHVYSDLLAGRIDPSAFGFLSRDMEATVRRMERFASSAAALYAELESLAELELSAKKLPPSEDARKVFDQRLQWQRHGVEHLRDSSLWNEAYDKVVLLLARAVCTIHSRISQVFGNSLLELENLLPKERLQLTGPLRSDTGGNILGRSAGINFHKDGLRFSCGANPGKLFLECLSLSSTASLNDNGEILREQNCVPFRGEEGGLRFGKPAFGPKSRLTMLASSSTVGGSALALHYANIIIIIEKLLSFPHLIGDEAKDDLYLMLPGSLKEALRKSLKSYAKDLSIYDASLAHDWKEAIKGTLSWLSPMAHKMIQWQAERNFEQQQIVLRGGVLLLQTLYFTDRKKTEAAICELLVGLNYICRYEQQQAALLDCDSSMDLDDGVDWQMRY